MLRVLTRLYFLPIDWRWNWKRLRYIASGKHCWRIWKKLSARVRYFSITQVNIKSSVISATISERFLLFVHRISPIIVEPYNSLLSTHYSMDYSDCCIPLDNEALYDVCGTNLGVCSPTYTNLNRIVSQVVSSCTASLRFSGSTNVDLQEFQTNLVPYPRIHFPSCTYAPLVSNDNGSFAEFSTEQLTQFCFHPNSQLVKCDLRKGKYICCCMLYRGDVEQTEINCVIREIKSQKTLKFVDWSPTSFKIGINYQPPSYVPGGDLCPVNRAMCMLSNK